MTEEMILLVGKMDARLQEVETKLVAALSEIENLKTEIESHRERLGTLWDINEKLETVAGAHADLETRVDEIEEIETVEEIENPGVHGGEMEEVETEIDPGEHKAFERKEKRAHGLW